MRRSGAGDLVLGPAPDVRGDEDRAAEGATQPRERGTWPDPRSRRAPIGYRTTMFFFFSNRLGCLGSLLLSALVTLILLLAFDVL